MGGQGPLKSTFEIDPIKIAIKTKQDMITAKFAHTLCTQYNQIFSIGGYEIVSASSDCEVYDTIGNKWKQLPKLNTPRHGCAAMIFGKMWVYAIAGFNEDDLNSVERLPILGNSTWANVNIS